MQEQEKAMSAERMERVWAFYGAWMKDRFAKGNYSTPETEFAAAFAAEEVRLERERCAKAVCADCRAVISLIISGETELYRHYIVGPKSETILTSYCAAKPIWELSRDGRE